MTSIGSFTSHTSVVLNFAIIDDRLRVNVNGTDVVMSGIVRNNKPPAIADLTSYLRTGSNTIHVTAINDTYLASLFGTLSVDSKVVKKWAILNKTLKTFVDDTFTVNYKPTGTAIAPTTTALGMVQTASVDFAQIDDRVAVSVNGVQVLAHALLRPKQSAISLNLTPYLIKGKNEIRIVAINELGAGVLLGSLHANGKVVKTYKITGDSRFTHRPFVNESYTLTH